MEHTILIVEDEKGIRETVTVFLKNQGYNVLQASNGEEGLALIEANEIHLAVVDIMMPVMDGITMVLKLRENYDFPVIFLSAKSEDIDKITGLNIGGDDYVTKPFGPAELIARVDALHRRVNMVSAKPIEDPNEIRSGPFVLNERSRTLTKNGQNIDLTQVEFQIMECFLKNPNVALERNTVLSKVWGENYFGDVKIVDVNIRRLRMKIEDEPSNPKYLTTVWGYGYKWSVNE